MVLWNLLHGSPVTVELVVLLSLPELVLRYDFQLVRQKLDSKEGSILFDEHSNFSDCLRRVNVQPSPLFLSPPHFAFTPEYWRFPAMLEDKLNRIKQGSIGGTISEIAVFESDQLDWLGQVFQLRISCWEFFSQVKLSVSKRDCLFQSLRHPFGLLGEILHSSNLKCKPRDEFIILLTTCGEPTYNLVFWQSVIDPFPSHLLLIPRNIEQLVPLIVFNPQSLYECIREMIFIVLNWLTILVQISEFL